MQYTLHMEQEHIRISISRAPAVGEKPKKQGNISSIFLPSKNKENTYRNSCIEFLNSSYRKIL